ncbi:response regulator [Anaerotardibacter muris]|uniref:response regulator n=1 Tax=Anaerotardibacter muris TaxID=2941505 RepID=UPI00203AD99A|nr:transporter substrate-binding domain-containing protein [Anaerotardibacter muris]
MSALSNSPQNDSSSKTTTPNRRGALIVAAIIAAVVLVVFCAVTTMQFQKSETATGSATQTQTRQLKNASEETFVTLDNLEIGKPDSTNRTVKAGVFAFDGYHMKDEDGELYGYGIEVLEMISKYSHLNFDLVGYDASWQDMMDMLEAGEIDLVTSASKTPEREAKFDFSLPIGQKSTVLSVAASNDKLISGDYATYNGMVVGEIPGNSQNDILAEFAKEKNFTYTVRQFTDNEALAQALQDGTVDAIVTSDLRKTNNEKTLDTIDTDNYYVIVRKGDTQLLSEVNYAIDQMNMNEGDWKHTLYYDYYGPTFSNEIEFTAREQAYIDEVRAGTKKISAIAASDRSPYSFEENGKLNGILIDYFAAVMEVADLPYEIVVPSDLQQYQLAIESERVNVVLDGIVGQYSSGDYFDNSFKSDAFMSASIVQVTRDDFAGQIKTIAVPDSSTGGLNGFWEDQEGVELIHYPTREAALQAVLDGDADCTYTYVYTAQQFMNRDSSDGLTYNAVYGLDVQFDMLVTANTDHELVSILNKCIKRVPESTLNRLVADYTSYSATDMTFFEYLEANPIILIVLGLLIAMVAVIIIALVLRGRWSNRLIATQEQSNQELKEQLSIVEALSHDYTNVFSVDPKKGVAKVIKLEGYVTRGLHDNPDEEQDYTVLVNHYIDDRVHPDDKELLRKEMSLDHVREETKSGEEYQGTYRILVDGEEHNFQYTYVMVEDGEDDFLLVGFRNIDEMVRKEQEQNEVLSEALAQAQYANQAKTTFLNNMSHDIRTPMNAIIGFTALAGTHIDNTDQVRSYLSKIMTSSNHLLSLINDVLDMSRIESGKVKIENKETNLPEVMHDLRTIVQSDIKAKGLEFYIDMLDVRNETVICDKLRLNQVLLNILSNAVKYTPQGGTVSVRITQTEAVQPDGTAEYQFSVRDTGIGMSPTFLEHVFEPFEREETATVSGIQGTGLGLAITKNIVDMMEGDISVTSTEGEGSEFVVKFRFKVAEGSEPLAPPEELKDLRALVVDDDVDTCTSVSSMLLSIGMRPDWTTLGEEAIAHTKFATEQGDPYSAFIIDWIMPNMSGLELVKRIRRIIGDETPIIIATAYDWTDIEEEVKEAGVTAICSKPIFLSELREILMRPFTDETESDEVIVAQGNDNIDLTDAFDQAAEKFKGKHILLAEDNEMSREIAITVLEDAGIIVDAVEDGKYAVERMKENPAGTYDVVLTDVQMPIMNGYETTRAIRALDDPAKASIPIIAVTANAFEEDREEAEEAGMSGYVPKPINIETLFETLEDLLDD